MKKKLNPFKILIMNPTNKLLAGRKNVLLSAYYNSEDVEHGLCMVIRDQHSLYESIAKCVESLLLEYRNLRSKQEREKLTESFMNRLLKTIPKYNKLMCGSVKPTQGAVFKMDTATSPKCGKYSFRIFVYIWFLEVVGKIKSDECNGMVFGFSH